MSADQIKMLVSRFYQECNRGEAAGIAVLNELFASDITWHNATGRDIHGLDNLKTSFHSAYSTFPDTHYAIEDIITEGDKAASRFTFTGTHKGEFKGITPSGKQVKMWGINIVHVKDGKFQEVWERYDTLASMREMGIMGASEKQK